MKRLADCLARLVAAYLIGATVLFCGWLVWALFGPSVNVYELADLPRLRRARKDRVKREGRPCPDSWRDRSDPFVPKEDPVRAVDPGTLR